MPIPEDRRARLCKESKPVAPESPATQDLLKVGDVVQAADRGNYGKIVAVLDDGHYRVKFVEPQTGSTTIKIFSADMLTRMEQPSKKKESCDDANEPELRQWPKLNKGALYGIAGDFVKLATRSSEADPAAVLATFLCRFGVEAGSGPCLYVGDTRHYARINAAVIGNTSKARKGTSAKPLIRLFLNSQENNNFYIPARTSPGPLSSGEGLIYQVHDPIMSWKVHKKTGLGQWIETEPGIDDKRLFILDEEFAAALKSIGREGNNLSVIIRSIFDTGNLEPLTKNNRIKATGAHIGITTHITLSELSTLLKESEALNGFANRFLWVCARRNGLVPLPEPMPDKDLLSLQKKVFKILSLVRAMQKITISNDFKYLWLSKYSDLSKDEPGLVGSVVNRAEALVMRLSMIYALMDGVETIESKHLEAALAFWSYAKDSAYFIFGDREADPTAQKILDALKDGPVYLTDLHRTFSNHTTKLQIQSALSELCASGKIGIDVEQTKGRSRNKIFILEKRELSEKSHSEENRNPEIVCADCQYFAFDETPNLPGKCTGEPWDDSRTQAPKVPHECPDYLAR